MERQNDKIKDIEKKDEVYGESVIDKLLDADNCENIILFDEKNEEVEFEQVAVIPLFEKIYVILAPVTEIAGVGEDEALVFVIEEIDDEDSLVIVDDTEVVDAVFEEYYKLLREEGEDV